MAQVPIDPNELIDPTGVGLEEVVVAVAVLVVALVAGALVRRAVLTAASKWSASQPDFAIFLSKLAGWFVVLIGITATLLIIGIQLGPIFLILVVVSVILFLSARTLLENFGAGIVLQTEKAFRIGELVEVADQIGTVHEITGRTTVLDTIDGHRIRIPNTDILSEPIVNLAERRALLTEVEVGVEYGTDLDHARDVILRAVVGVGDDVLGEPPPEVLVAGFGESSIGFSVRFWHVPDLLTRKHLIDRVSRAIDESFRAEGIVIAFPQVVVWTPEVDQGDDS